ncbi:MAG: carotenoid biosynthesis protein [Chloroflexi bacterium]|jgi:putative membrane protein|uniref:carotenoid biosynthesis protein n=1 Tax=Candidatus Roseilinea sp. NK_OTU-006 TaxID=2704250 RepID=UPI000F16ED23|nr:carotenoid biosynthesis protein [Candidatus Roseilinea sp. NK_OTU-006]RMG63836.1 MAG: carotenoid biosynthesis protein [Chloroflexota bacterium]
MSSAQTQSLSGADAARVWHLSPILFALYLLSMPVYCLVRLSGQQALTGLSTAFTAISLFSFSLAHCSETRGIRHSSLMLLASFAIALTMEYLGSTYGLIFGNYDYTDNLGPKALGKVPIIIPVAWFMMLYPAWSVAEVLVARRRNARHDTAARHLVLPIVPIGIAALAMTAWDLSLDPRMVADGNWVWRDGGAYFGIPLSNYVGWFLTSALIYGAWHGIERSLLRWPKTERIAQTPRASHRSPLDFRLLPVWAYVVTWLGESLANALFWGGPAIAAAVFAGMGLFGGPALWTMLRMSRRVPPVA